MKRQILFLVWIKKQNNKETTEKGPFCYCSNWVGASSQFADYAEKRAILIEVVEICSNNEKKKYNENAFQLFEYRFSLVVCLDI